MTRNRIYIIIFGIIALLWLSSCRNVLLTSDLPTLLPAEYLPTAIALTSQVMIARTVPPPAPQVTPTPQEATPTPTTQHTATPAPSSEAAEEEQNTSIPRPTTTLPPPVEIPYADIQIISPGPLSKVVTPIELHVFLIPGAGGKVRVELFGEDGRLMYRKIFVFDSPPDAQTNLRADLDFEIPGVAETAWLVVSIDDGYGRLKALASENLILLSLGDADINPPGDLLEPIVIQQPAPKVLIQGGMLIVSGLVRTASDLPLLVELITTDGRVVGSRLAGIAPDPQGGHRLFAAEVPYQVYSPTWVRVTVSERGTRLAGTTQLSSVEVLLGP